MRVKWIELTTTFSLMAIGGRLASRQYQSDIRPVGFELVEMQTDRLQARFIREIVETQTELDPFGTPIVNTFRRYVWFEFFLIVTKASIILRIHNPPRSLKDFVAEFASLLDNSITLQELELDVDDFLKFLKKAGFAKQVRVRSALFSDVPLTTNSRGKVLVVSSVDAIQDFQSKLTGGILDKAVIDLEKGGRRIGSVELNKKGSLRVGDDTLFGEIQTFDTYMAERLSQRSLQPKRQSIEGRE